MPNPWLAGIGFLQMNPINYGQKTEDLLEGDSALSRARR
jgi:hypothetical protein